MIKSKFIVHVYKDKKRIKPIDVIPCVSHNVGLSKCPAMHVRCVYNSFLHDMFIFRICIICLHQRFGKTVALILELNFVRFGDRIGPGPVIYQVF